MAGGGGGSRAYMRKIIAVCVTEAITYSLLEVCSQHIFRLMSDNVCCMRFSISIHQQTKTRVRAACIALVTITLISPIRNSRRKSDNYVDRHMYRNVKDKCKLD